MADGSAPPPRQARPVASAIAGWARALSQVGGRNTLLWAPDRPGGYLDLTTAHPGGVSRLLAGRVTYLSDLVREPGAWAEALDVVREIHDRTRRLEEQRGLVSCFVACGMATWDPPRPGAAIAAPVLLRGCRLRPTSSGADDFHIDLASSVEVNPVLVHYLRSVAGIAVDPVGLADLSRVASRFDPYPVYAVLRQSCAALPGFVLTPRLVIGAYPYAKLSMVADLTENGEWLAEVDLVAAFAGEEAAQDRVGTTLPDTDPDLAGEGLVLDADAEQSSVVDAVRAGRSLVLHAPHGTGGTQTIANVVAALASDGRRTLVVSRFPATITDLTDRLAGAGLEDLVLDLPRAEGDRHAVTAALGRRLSHVRGTDGMSVPSVDEQTEQRRRRLAEHRQRLVDHVAAMHEQRSPWGVTVHEIQGAMAALGFRTPAPASRVRLRGEALRALSRSRVEDLAEQLRHAGEAGAWSAHRGGDPWYGARITTDDEVARAEEVVTRLAHGRLAAAASLLDDILADSGMPPARCAEDWETAVRTMGGVRDTLEVFRPEIFDAPLDEHLVASGTRSDRAASDVKLGWLARARVRRRTRWLLRPGRPPADLHAELLSAQEQRQAWHRLVGAGGRPEVSPRLDEAREALDGIGADLSWLGEHLSGSATELTHLPTPVLRERVEHLAARVDRLEILPAVTPTLARLRDAGIGEVLDDFARRGIPPASVRPELEHIWWASLALEITEADPRCRDHDGPQLREAAHRFRELDVQRREEAARLVRAQVAARARKQLGRRPAQVELLRSHAAGERWPAPFRDLFRECEDVLSALHPCVALSPYAVGDLLPPTGSFDLVVVEDAASLTTAEVVSALSRARQALVVGDPAGVRPASFVVGPSSPPRAGELGADRVTSGDAPTAPSVLEVAGGFLPVRRLAWRHGEVDARLTGLAGDDLLGVPAVDSRSPVRIERVSGSARVPPGEHPTIPWTSAEVDRIVDLVIEHARRDPHRSLGVVAITPELAREVDAALRRALHDLASNEPDDSALAFFDENRREPVLVADLASFSAGRDVVVLGVGYGRTTHGGVLHRFPSLAGVDAPERLARAASLARAQLVVVSALSAADLDPDRLQSPGARTLRELLAFAEGAAVRARGLGRREPHPLLSDLATRLRHEGLLVEPHVGPGRYPVELAVGLAGSGGRWLVAVETDGEEYAGLSGVRDRERLRVEQLQRLGWVPLRIWTTDLYRDPAREVARVVAAVRAARRARGASGPPGPPRQNGVEDDSPASLTSSGARLSAAGAVVEDEQPVEHTEPDKGRRRLRWRRGPVDEEPGNTGPEPGDEQAHDRWLQEQRPPHWE